MRKSSSRLLAGLVALGLFAAVGVFTVRAFAAPVVPNSGDTAATQSTSPWDETRSGSITKP